MLTIEQLLDEVKVEIPTPSDTGDEFPMIYERYQWGWISVPNDIRDIYTLLDDYGRTHPTRLRPLEAPEAFCVVTSGWAAPLGDNGEVEGAPSEHPSRRRVSLFYLATPSGAVASRLFFHDTAENVFDDGTASGALGEAIDRVSAYVWGARFVQALSEWALQHVEDEADIKAALGRLVRVRLLFDDEPALRFEEN